jgi:hypothetical protein
MEMVRRIRTPEEAALVLEVAHLFAITRANRQYFRGLIPQHSNFLLKVSENSRISGSRGIHMT